MSATSNTIIEVRDLTKVFGSKPHSVLPEIEKGRTRAEIHEATDHLVAVRRANFEVRQGEIFIVMGLSGSGKSTLVRMLNRLIEPTDGQVLIHGDNILDMSDRDLIDLRRRDIAMVFQHFALMPHLDNFDNAAFGLDVAGIGEPERSRRVGNALDMVGLSDFAHSYPHELSGGMKQRVGLARALSVNPTIMLLDEAFSALDPLIRTDMQDELVQIQRKHDITIVFISHDLREALRIGDRLAIMENGEIVQVGTPRELVLNPANDYVREFLRDVDKRQVLVASDLMEPAPAVQETGDDTTPAALQRRFDDSGVSFLYLQDRDGRFRGVASRESLHGRDAAQNMNWQDVLLDDIDSLAPGKRFYDMVDSVASAPCAVPVVDENGVLQGVVTQSAMLGTLHNGRED